MIYYLKRYRRFGLSLSHPQCVKVHCFFVYWIMIELTTPEWHRTADPQYPMWSFYYISCNVDINWCEI